MRINGKTILCCLSFLLLFFSARAQHRDTLAAIKDSYVRSSNATTNYGSNNPLIVAAGLFGSGITRTLLQFDLSQIPKDAKITAATLVIVREMGFNGESQYLRKVTSNWDEPYVTWNSQPSFTTTGQISVPGGLYEAQVSINVLSHLPEMVCLNNYGWVLQMQNESSGDNVRYFSREETLAYKRPMLVVTWYDPISLDVVTAPAATLSATDGGASLTVSGGRAPFSYEWRNTSNTLVATTKDITGHAAGLYKLKITDANSTVYYAYVIIPSYQGEMTVEIQPDPDYGMDANLRTEFFFNEMVEFTNYGNDTSFTTYRIGLILPNTFGAALLRFNFFGLPPETLLKTANLHLYGSNHSIGTESFLERVTSTWCEPCVTYATAPPSTAINRVALSAVSAVNQNYMVDVQSFVQHYLNNPTDNFGYLLSVENSYSGSTTKRLNFYSSDEPTQTAKRPKLELTFKVPSQYATLTRRPDGGTYRCTERLFFYYREEYKELDGKLRYNLYNLADNTVQTQEDYALDVAYGDNFLTLELGTSGLDLPSGYYLLEVIGQKAEKFYLRVFKTN